MITQHARALFCRTVHRRRDRGVLRRVRSDRAGRLHRDDAKDVATPTRRPGWSCKTSLFRVPQTARAADAVLRADRGDVLLSQPVAAARAGGRARRRRVGLAVPDAGARQRACDRRASRPPSTIRSRPACRSRRSATRSRCSATVRRCCRTRIGFWVNQATSEGQTIIHAATSQRRGELLTGADRLPLRSSRARFSERIEARDGDAARTATGCSRTSRRHTFNAPVSLRGHLSADHESDARAGARKLSRRRNRSRSGSCPNTSRSSENSGLVHRRLSAAIPEAAVAPVFAGGNGASGIRGQPALLPAAAACRKWF